MSEELQSLLDKINADGIQKAEAEAAEHHGLHIAVLAHLTEELADDLITAHHIRGAGIVVLPAEICCQQMHGLTDGEQGAVKLTCITLFKFVHTFFLFYLVMVILELFYIWDIFYKYYLCLLDFF